MQKFILWAKFWIANLSVPVPLAVRPYFANLAKILDYFSRVLLRTHLSTFWTTFLCYCDDKRCYQWQKIKKYHTASQSIPRSRAEHFSHFALPCIDFFKNSFASFRKLQSLLFLVPGERFLLARCISRQRRNNGYCHSYDLL